MGNGMLIEDAESDRRRRLVSWASGTTTSSSFSSLPPSSLVSKSSYPNRPFAASPNATTLPSGRRTRECIDPAETIPSMCTFNRRCRRKLRTVKKMCVMESDIAMLSSRLFVLVLFLLRSLATRSTGLQSSNTLFLDFLASIDPTFFSTKFSEECFRRDRKNRRRAFFASGLMSSSPLESDACGSGFRKFWILWIHNINVIVSTFARRFASSKVIRSTVDRLNSFGAVIIRSNRAIRFFLGRRLEGGRAVDGGEEVVEYVVILLVFNPLMWVRWVGCIYMCVHVYVYVYCVKSE